MSSVSEMTQEELVRRRRELAEADPDDEDSDCAFESRQKTIEEINQALSKKASESEEDFTADQAAGIIAAGLAERCHLCKKLVFKKEIVRVNGRPHHEKCANQNEVIKKI